MKALASLAADLAPLRQRNTKTVRVLLVSPYELGRQPFGLASPAACLRADGHQVTCTDLAVEKLSLDTVRNADLIAFHLCPLWFAIILSARNSLTWHGMQTNNRGHASLFPLDLSIRPAPDERSPSHRDRKCCPATATRGLPAKTETTGSDDFRSTVLDLSPQLVVRLAQSINLCPG